MQLRRKPIILRVMFHMKQLLWTLLCFYSVGLPLVFAQQPQPQTCEQRLVMVQEQLADAKAVATQFYLPNMGLQAETVVTLNRKLSESQARETQQAATITGLREELARCIQQSQDTAKKVVPSD